MCCIVFYYSVKLFKKNKKTGLVIYSNKSAKVANNAINSIYNMINNNKGKIRKSIITKLIDFI
jgi:3'-phosphoadenosine 5'-phosphosulfate sulfotransferase